MDKSTGTEMRKVRKNLQNETRVYVGIKWITSWDIVGSKVGRVSVIGKWHFGFDVVGGLLGAAVVAQAYGTQ